MSSPLDATGIKPVASPIKSSQDPDYVILGSMIIKISHQTKTISISWSRTLSEKCMKEKLYAAVAMRFYKANDLHHPTLAGKDEFGDYVLSFSAEARKKQEWEENAQEELSDLEIVITPPPSANSSPISSKKPLEIKPIEEFVVEEILLTT